MIELLAGPHDRNGNPVPGGYWTIGGFFALVLLVALAQYLSQRP